MNIFAIHTLGCKVNQYETDAIIGLLKKEGYKQVDFNELADVYIINTCTVTAAADRKSCQIIRKAKRQNPNAMVVVTGCLAQASPEAAAIPGVNAIIGNNDKAKIVQIIQSVAEGTVKKEIADIMTVKEYDSLKLYGTVDKTRAFIKIQEGCDNFCTYCIIPYARGPLRSRAIGDIMQEASRLADAGYTELVLVGIHLTKYGKDLGNCNLVDVIEELHKIQNIRRIRLGSLEYGALMHEIADKADSIPRLCAHFHISLQSGSDKTLQRMNRSYTSQEYKTAVDKLRAAFGDVAITTDIMVGFPGETDEDFAVSLEFARNIGFARIHVFPYSPRKGTKAAQMPEQINEKVKTQRAKIMQQMADEAANSFNKGFINESIEVLFEQPDESGNYIGHAANYLQVKAKTHKSLKGEFRMVKIIGVEGDMLIGEIEEAT